MSLSIGIVGLPNVGKSTLFKVLTKKQVDIANYPFCTIDPSVGVVEVPDERVKKLVPNFPSPKKSCRYRDGIRGHCRSGKRRFRRRRAGQQISGNIREVDAIAEVVRVFDNDKIIHVHNKIDPSGDVGVVETELILVRLGNSRQEVWDIGKRSQVWQQRNCQKTGDRQKNQNCFGTGQSRQRLRLER